MANYVIDPQILQKYLPPHTELDFFEGKTYVSVIGFMFLKTKVLGIGFPWHKNFPEINLRFYVRYKHGNDLRRGTVFIKEIIPKPIISFVANTLYKEHYQTLPMRHNWDISAEKIKTDYAFKFKGKWHDMSVTAAPNLVEIPVGSKEEFITEHYFGYTPASKTTTYEYEVTHPRWEMYPVRDYKINIDFAAVYGADFGFLDSAAPDSVLLAEGSAITIEGKRLVKG